MPEFISVYNLRNLAKQKTCFKNSSWIDLILTNSPRSFQNSSVLEAGLSGFHKLATTVLKQYFPELKAKVVNYRDYRKFRNVKFRIKRDNETLKDATNNTEYQHFLNIFINIFNKPALIKQKYLRGNKGRFRTKDLHEAIMKCSKLRNTFFHKRTETSPK